MSQLHTQSALKLTRRLRRLRTSGTMRALVQETRLSADMFVLPLFVCEGEGVRREVPSMPGVSTTCRSTKRSARSSARRETAFRACCCSAFPTPKTTSVRRAYDPEAPVQSAIRAIKQELPDVLVVTDVCLCEYTDHGHCGIVIGGEIANDPSVDQLVRAAVSHAAAGADIVAPSDMMDGRVGAIRHALDERGFEHTAIMSYAAKYCSAFYGPFRDAAGSMPQFGDRKTHQMDPANVREALREVEQDIEEGADIVMVKPALPYLDVIARVKDTVRPSHRRVPRERRVCDAEGRRAQRLARRAARDARIDDGDPPRGSRHHHHLLRTRGWRGPLAMNGCVTCARKSARLFSRAQRILPGGVDSPVRAFKSVGSSPLFIRRAHGARLEDVDGNQFIDYVMSWGPLIHGHAPRGLVAALKKAVSDGTSYGAPSPLEVDLGERVRRLMPSLERVRFVNSGTEAAMSADPGGARRDRTRTNHQVRRLLPWPRGRVSRRGRIRCPDTRRARPARA